MTQKQFVRHFCGDVRLGNGQYTSKTYFLFNVKRGKSTGWSKKKKRERTCSSDGPTVCSTVLLKEEEERTRWRIENESRVTIAFQLAMSFAYGCGLTKSKTTECTRSGKKRSTTFFLLLKAVNNRSKVKRKKRAR